MATSPSFSLLLSSGARATEAALLSEVEACCGPGRDVRESLQGPVRILVPSSGLRQHLSVRIAEHFGRPVVGLRIQTLYGFAREILEQSGDVVRPAGILERVLVERAARASRELGPLLARLSEGYLAPLRSVRDLLDCGLSEGPGVTVARESLGRGEGAPVRASEVLDIALETRRMARGSGLDLTGDILERATRRVSDEGVGLKTRSLLVHGFSDATGVALGLLGASLTAWGGTVFVDLPRGLGPGREDGLELGRALETASGLGAGYAGSLPEPDPRRCATTTFGARGAEGEVREVARRIRALVDGGTRPEDIAIAARSLEGYAHAIRRQLGRLAIPFSGGEGLGPPRALARWSALPELLESAASQPADEWLELLGSNGGRRITASHRARLRLACRSLGFSRLGDLAGPEAARRLPASGSYGLPLVTHLESSDGEQASRARRSFMSVTELEALFARAAAVIDCCEALPERASVGRFAEGLEGLVELLDDEPPAELTALLEALLHAPDFPLSRGEFLRLLEARLEDLGRGGLGGRGSGVSVLSVREARSRTFGHLFLLGVNRGAFPRQAADDPLLPEYLRTSLRRGLPLLPRVGAAPSEERYLFAQLLSSSPEVTLSWQKVDDSGRAGSPSPLLAFLSRRAAGDAVDALPAIPPQLPRPSPLEDYLARAALYEDRTAFSGLLPLAVEAARSPGMAGTPVSGLGAVAAARTALLREADPDPTASEDRRRWSGPGPFLGQVGAASVPSDPRRRTLSAKTLEGLAVCPWQAFLSSFLGLSEMPDPRGSIPQATARLVGLLVHQVLEDLACERGLDPGGELAEVIGRTAGVRIPVPGDEQLAERCLRRAQDLVEIEGLLLPGLAELLQRRALGFFEVAFAEGSLPLPAPGAAATDPPPGVLGVEVDGMAELAGHRIRFRADRVDRIGEELVFVDYKAGRPISRAVRPSTRLNDYRKAVAAGRRLQAAIYAAAVGAAEARGRFMFLRPDVEPPSRQVDHGPADEELSEVAEATVHALADGLYGGQLFPRLVEPRGDKEPSACGRCRLTSACLRGDSSARARLGRHAASLADELPPAGERDPSEVFAVLWRLPTAGKGSGR